MPREKRQISGKQYFRAKFDNKTIDTEKRTIDVVFVTENRVMMYNWDIGLFYEILPCNDQSGDISRLNNGAPLCDTHDTSSVKNGLGVVEKAWFDNGIGRATVRFSKRSDVEPIWQDVQDQIITGISVGYQVNEYEEIGVKDNLPLVRGNSWEALEISLALVQADPDSGVGRSLEDSNINHEVTFIRKNSNNKPMKRSVEILKLCRAAGLSEEYAAELIDGDLTIEQCRSAIEAKKLERTPTPIPVPAPAPVNEAEVSARAAKTERERISEIQLGGRAAKLEATFVQKLIDDGTPLESARKMIIDQLAKAAPTDGPTPVQSVHVGKDEAEKRSKGMEASILGRTGIVKPEVAGEPGEFRGMTLMDLAKDCLRAANIDFRGKSQMEIATRALSMQTRDGGGGLATGDFSYILANVLNKVLRTMYDLQVRTFQPFCRKSTATDFKQMLRTQLNDIKLTQVQEGGGYTFAQLGDTGEVYKVAKFGKIVNIDWEAIINDDLSAFTRVPTLMAGAVAQMQGDIIYNNILNAAVHLMGDGVTLFDAATHKNFTTPGTAISIASMNLARQLMRQQVTPGNNFLNIAPKYLVVGPQQEAYAMQFTSTNYVPIKQGDYNPFSGILTVIVDARITDKSWYFIADPMLIDTIEYATLDGQELYTEARYGFDVDALQWKVRSVFGGKAIEWRSQYKNAGA